MALYLLVARDDAYLAIYIGMSRHVTENTLFFL